VFTRKKLIGGGILAAVSLAAVAAFVWFAVLPGDAPERVSLSDAVASVEGGTDSPAPSTAAATSQGASLAGQWVLAPGSESFVGYRVREELARIGAFTAVGRTRDLTASLQFDGSAVRDVQVQAQLTGLKSDSAMRDGALRRQALEIDRFPTAAFTLTSPIAIGGVPADGTPLRTTANGDLTLHGVTRPIAIDLEGALTNGRVVVVGSTEIRFADFGIAQPSSAAVLSIEDRGTLELQLVFQQASQG
jgi:polyisoprenoid-binding protein YceI